MDYSKFSEETLDKISKNEPLDYSKLSDVELEEITKSSSPGTILTPVKPQEIKGPEEIGQLESGIRGAADYGSFGFADELEAMLRSGSISGEEYEKKRDELREVYKQAAEQNPLTYHGAGIAAGFALPIGGIGGLATKGATLGSKVARSALMGGGMGALAGAGTSEAEDIGGIAKDVATGAAAGAIAGPAIEGGFSALSRFGEGAYKNIGSVKAIVDTAKLAAKGERIAGEQGAKLTTAKALKSAEDVVKELKSVQEAKNKAYRAAEEASTFEMKVQDLKKKIADAEAKGADPAQLKNLKQLVNKLTGEEQIPEASDELGKMLSETYNTPTGLQGVEETAEKTLRPADLNLLKQEAKRIKSRIYGAPSDAANELADDLNKLYKGSIDATEAEGIDKNLREALAKLSISNRSMSKPKLGVEEIERLTDKLVKKTVKAGKAPGSVEFNKTEDAFKKLTEVYPEGSPERANIQQKLSTLKEDAYKSFLSELTTGHNTFAISPGNFNWLLTAPGKLGYAAEGVGAAYRGIVNSSPGQLLGMANKIRKSGYEKYANTLNNIAGTEDVNKRRALTFTLLQNPDFRELIVREIFTQEEE